MKVLSINNTVVFRQKNPVFLWERLIAVVLLQYYEVILMFTSIFEMKWLIEC